jgi:hypothetical protein
LLGRLGSRVRGRRRTAPWTSTYLTTVGPWVTSLRARPQPLIPCRPGPRALRLLSPRPRPQHLRRVPPRLVRDQRRWATRPAG